MKKLIWLIAMISVVFCLSSCEEKEEKIYVQYSKASVDEFMTAVGSMRMRAEYDTEAFVGPLKSENCYNVTPEEIKNETEVQVFRFSDNMQSFFYLDEEIYDIISLGGYGFMSGVTCDFDSDGNKDILYTTSWGSGIHRTDIWVFNTVTKERVYVASSSIDLNYAHADLIVRKNTQDDGTAIFEVCLIEIDYSTDSSGFSYKVIETIGRVEAKNGAPVFIGE